MPMTREAARWDEAIADLFASNRDEDAEMDAEPCDCGCGFEVDA